MQLIKKNFNLKDMLQLGAIICCIIILVSYGFTYIYHGFDKSKANIFGYKLCYVGSGSMEPTIETGSIVLCKIVSEKEIELGDIYNYSYQNTYGTETIIHRIISQNEDGTYVFKGDNNPAKDIDSVQSEQISSKYILTVYEP